MIYNTPASNQQQLLQAQKMMANAVTGRRHKSTVRGIQGGQLISIGNQYDSAGNLHGG
jgi:hypothetical protein